MTPRPGCAWIYAIFTPNPIPLAGRSERRPGRTKREWGLPFGLHSWP
jgi:hypothetical protein